MSVLATRQRVVSGRARRLAYLDPVVHLPNLRALNRALQNAPRSTICFTCRARAVGKIMASCYASSISKSSLTGLRRCWPQMSASTRCQGTTRCCVLIQSRISSVLKRWINILSSFGLSGMDCRYSPCRRELLLRAFSG